jgi:hypothetical protein
MGNIYCQSVNTGGSHTAKAGGSKMGNSTVGGSKSNYSPARETYETHEKDTRGANGLSSGTNVSSGNLIMASEINTLKDKINSAIDVFVDGSEYGIGKVSATKPSFTKANTNTIGTNEWNDCTYALQAFDSSASTVSSSDTVQATHYNDLMAIYNSLVGTCVCHSDCGCNKICICFSDCYCNYS